MEIELETKKTELLEWLKNVEDKKTLDEIEVIKQNTRPKFDFDKAWENGYTPEEIKKEMRKRINAYPWKE